MRKETAFLIMASILTLALIFVLGVIGVMPDQPAWWAVIAIADCIGLCCYLWGES